MPVIHPWVCLAWAVLLAQLSLQKLQEAGPVVPSVRVEPLCGCRHLAPLLLAQTYLGKGVRLGSCT